MAYAELCVRRLLKQGSHNRLTNISYHNPSSDRYCFAWTKITKFSHAQPTFSVYYLTRIRLLCLTLQYLSDDKSQQVYISCHLVLESSYKSQKTNVMMRPVSTPLILTPNRQILFQDLVLTMPPQNLLNKISISRHINVLHVCNGGLVENPSTSVEFINSVFLFGEAWWCEWP